MRSAFLTALALLCLLASAQAQAQGVYTGCIASATGSLYAVREASTPAYPCQKKDKPISWHIAGEPGPPGPPLPPLLQPLVECNNPSASLTSISAALAQQADRLNVSISGNCVEAVEISRDDVTLRGVGTNPTIMPPEGMGSAILIKGAQRVVLKDLSLTGGSLNVSDGASLNANNLRITGSARTGLSVENNSSAQVSDSWIENNQGGVGVDMASSLVLSDSSVLHNGHIGLNLFSSDVWFIRTTVAGNEMGIYSEKGRLDFFECTIRDNTGEGVHLAASLFFSGWSVIENNRTGIGADAGSVVVLDNATIQGNPGGGVAANLGSVVSVSSASTIDGGGAPGIGLGDTCTAEVPETSSVTGYPVGVSCAPFPSGAHLKWPWPSTVSTDCPKPVGP